MADRSIEADDVVQECYLHLLRKLPDYDPKKAEILDWVYWQSYHYLLSYFRTLTHRRQLRQREAEKTTPSRKGVVRYGKTFEVPPAELEDYSDTSLDTQAYRRLGREADSRPGDEATIDLYDAIDSLPDHLKTIMQYVLDGESVDKIAWRLDVHPTNISAKIREARAWLVERMN